MLTKIIIINERNWNKTARISETTGINSNSNQLSTRRLIYSALQFRLISGRFGSPIPNWNPLNETFERVDFITQTRKSKSGGHYPARRCQTVTPAATATAAAASPPIPIQSKLFQFNISIQKRGKWENGIDCRHPISTNQRTQSNSDHSPWLNIHSTFFQKI